MHIILDNKIRREMLSYYDERAQEYDEIYVGKAHTAIDPDVYEKDVVEVTELVSRFGKGHLIDIACGTGFWLPMYGPNCERITLLDQSARMLSECKDRVEKAELSNRSTFIQGDLLKLDLRTSEYNSALMGFLLSHLTSEQEETLWGKLEKILKINSQIMVIDSAWNEKRQQHQKKEGIQERVLRDGRRFKIYKRYFEQSDIEGMFKSHGFRIQSEYIGTAIVAAIAENN